MTVALEERPTNVRFRKIPLAVRGGPVPGKVGSHPSPGGLIVVSVWLGLVAGFLELGLLHVRATLINPAAMGLLQLNRHALWMVPLSDLLVFGSAGLVLGLVVALARSRWVAWGAAYGLGVLMAIAILLVSLRGLSTLAYATVACGIAARLLALVRAHARGFGRLVRVSLLPMILLLTGLVGVGLAREVLAERGALARLPAAPRGAPNVLFIVLDTVRAESLSLYGYGRETSPALTRLAGRAVRFGQARATACWTLPSHASMFTGRWPHELSARLGRPLDATYPTLAEFLRDRGYATAGFVANTFFCNSWYGLGRGFIHYDDAPVDGFEIVRCSAIGGQLLRMAAASDRDRPTASFRRKDAPTINREFLDWLARRPEGSPFFAFLNYYDAHDPYLLPDGAAKRFGTRSLTARELEFLRDWHRIDKGTLSADDVALARDCYDECLAYLDDQLGRLFRALDERGLLDDTVVVVTSDHGEQFGEHGVFEHGNSLHGQALHVPLLLFAPRRVPEGRVVPEPVSLRDLPATIVDLLGFDGSSPFPGRSLARHWAPSLSTAGPADDPPLSEIVDGDLPIPAGSPPPRALVSEGKVYIRNSDGREELYDLSTDPSELRDLAGREDLRSTRERFRRTLLRMLAGSSRPPSPL